MLRLCLLALGALLVLYTVLTSFVCNFTLGLIMPALIGLPLLIIGIFWQPQEYCIIENFGFTMRRFFDDETNEWVDKALAVVDGKVLNPVGYYLIKKKANS